MNFRFHPDAEAELLGAVDWYEMRSPGLGADMAAEVDAAIRRALIMPLAWPEMAPGIRRALTNRFPYGVLYAAREDGLLVLAVMHLRRDPAYWRQRVE